MLTSLRISYVLLCKDALVRRYCPWIELSMSCLFVLRLPSEESSRSVNDWPLKLLFLPDQRTHSRTSNSLIVEGTEHTQSEKGNEDEYLRIEQRGQRADNEETYQDTEA